MSKAFAVYFAIGVLSLATAKTTVAQPQAEVALAAYWSFDGSLGDKAGEVQDDLTARGDGGIAATARFVTTAQLPGASGQAVALGAEPGDAQYLSAPISRDLKLGSAYTIEMWIHPTDVAGWNRLVLNWGAAPKYAYHVAIHDGLLSLAHGQGDGKYVFAEGGAISSGRWYHIAAVAERNAADPANSRLTVYLNGRETGTGLFDGTIGESDTAGLGIGDSAGIASRSSRYKGYIDELKVWRRVLSNKEIAEHYNERADTINQLEQVRLKKEAAERKAKLNSLGIDDLPEIIFAERHPGRDPSGHYYANFGYACTDENEWLHGADGARLCRFDPASGRLIVLLDDPLGGIRDPQVSYDAKRILFSYRKGSTHNYNLYEINVDGTGLRQITSGAWDDVEPCYLPDGGIAFCSTRCKRYVLCWFAPVAILFRCNADGTDMQMLSSGAVTENTPSVLPDGCILYTRWEYVNRDAVSFHHLWTMNPDGTGQRIYYGNQTPGQVFIDAQPIPQTRSVVFIDSGYHGTQEHAGKVMVVSEASGPNSTRQLKSISPNGQGGFRDPFPISSDTFLVARGNRILILSDSQKTVELYAGGQMVHEPRLLKRRMREWVNPSRVDLSKESGTLFVSDVYRGRNMKGVKRGSIKKLLILEQLSKPVNYHGGGSTPIAHGGSWTLKRILGTVPVAEDGSAYFEVPAMRSIYMALLDEDDRSVKQMRSFVTLRPGEQRGCIGCHESRTKPPIVNRRPDALTRLPSRIQPIKGIPDIFDFPRDIQPILDRHCVSCHSAEKRDGGIVLTGNRGPTYSIAYYNLVLHRQIADGAGYGWEGLNNVNGRPIGNDKPYTTYSSAAPLMNKIDSSHHDVKLSEHERSMIRLWIDTAAQYAGTYAAYGTGQIGAWWRNNQPIREMADNWPSTLPSKESVERRCASCHGRMMPGFVTDQVPVDAFGDFEGWQRPTSRFSRHTVFDLTQPEKSLILMAPLSRKAGGYAAGVPQPAELISENRSKPPRPVSHPVIFESTDDPDYRNILAHLHAAEARLNQIKRFDMPGFKPRREYIREMKRYGIIAKTVDPDDPLDVYATDRAYFQAFWHKPSTQSE